MSLPLSYRLDELPSAQHRAGLAGLVGILRFLDLTSRFQLCSDSLRLELDQDTLISLVGLLYQGTDAVRYRKTRPTGGEFEQVERMQPDGSTAVVYRYRKRLPAAPWLSHLPHYELWQDVIWMTLRSVAATRKVYEGSAGELARKLYLALEKRTSPLPLTGSLYAGARARNAEGVESLATPDHALLLHFAHAYTLPFRVVEEHKGKSAWPGWVLAYPDPDDLTTFMQPTAYSSTVSGLHEAGLRSLLACSGLPRVFLAYFEARGQTQSVIETLHLKRGPRMEEAFLGSVQPLRHPAWRALVSQNVCLERPPGHGVGRLLRTLPTRSGDARVLCSGQLALIEDYLRRATHREARHRARSSERREIRARLAEDLKRRLLAAHSPQTLAALIVEMAVIAKHPPTRGSVTADDLLLALAACAPEPATEEISRTDEEPVL